MKSLAKISIFLLMATAMFIQPAIAQNANEANMEILVEKLKADKKLVVAQNMDFNDRQAKAFWPLYDAYQGELELLNQRMGKLIGEYANAYNSGSISNQTAGRIIKEWLTIEAEEVKHRVANVKKMGKVLPATKVARYMQIESKIRALIRYGLAEEIPLMY